MDINVLQINILTVVCCGFYCTGEYTDFTTLFWLKASENVDPADVWFNDTSDYNDPINMTSHMLLSASTPGYRNTMIDAWSTFAPDKIRVSFLNADGLTLFSEEFNSTGRSMSDWFSRTTAFWPTNSDGYVVNKSFISYKVSFSHENSDWGMKRYKSVVIPQYNGVTYYLVHNRDGPRILPAHVLNAITRCRLSFQTSNIFAYNSSTVANLDHGFCSAICRERNFPSGAVHDAVCSCINGTVGGASIAVCNTTCAGNTNQTCGGIHKDYPADSVIFDAVLTDIDTTQFDTPLTDYDTFTVNGSTEVSYSTRRIIHGYRFTVTSSIILPKVIRFEMQFRAEACNSFNLTNTTLQQTLVMDANPFFFPLEPIKVECVNITLSDDNYELLVFPVDITTVAARDNRFVTASILSIEAAWWIEPEVVAEDQCECECWVHNLLYGDSPYNNLTYSEIEDALRNVTDKLERELAVNKSELSSTIRSKTSADDSRASATAVGYTLGVALLTLSIGGIVFADIPKLWGNMNLMRENLRSRFCRQNATSPPDVTITNSANHTSRIT